MALRTDDLASGPRSLPPTAFRRYLLDEHPQVGRRIEKGGYQGKLHEISRSADGKVSHVGLSDHFLSHLDRALRAQGAETSAAESWYRVVEAAIAKLERRRPELVTVLRYYQVPRGQRPTSVVALAIEVGVSEDYPRRLLTKAIAAVWWELGSSW